MLSRILSLSTFCGCMMFLIISLIGHAAPTHGNAKHVIIDKTHQLLFAYEGSEIVLQCRISTGKGKGWTPNGDFRAGNKFLIHYSTLFEQAPMPYSVEVVGNIFVHGFSYVPPFPSSHGCIRLPLDRGNPARQFFNWVDVGTPIRITGEWNGSTKIPVRIMSPIRSDPFRGGF